MRCWWSTGSALFALVGAALGAPVSSATAQSAPDRAALRSLQDSLDSLTDGSSLGGFSTRWRHTDDKAMLRLRRGWLTLAAGRVSGKRGDLDAALMHFDWATQGRPRWPWPWLSRGLAKIALSEGRFIPKEMAGQALGVNFYQGALADLARAFEVDSAFADGVALLTRILPPQGDRTQPSAFVRALAVAAQDSAADPRVRLVLARAYRTGGQSGPALAELGAYLSFGGDSGLASLEQARTLAGAGRLQEAAGAYLDGASHRAQSTRAVYRRDLAWIATDAELAEFDTLPDSALHGWIGTFWAFRDAEALRLPGERLGEHLRRWAYAHRHFRIIAPERKTDFKRVIVADIGPCTRSGEKSLDDLTFQDPARLDDLRRRERLLDHRGVVYIRHGEPAHRLRVLPAQPGQFVPAALPSSGAGVAADAAIDPFLPQGLTDGQSQVSGLSTEIWHYWFGGESRLLYFSGSTTLGTFAPTTLYSYIPLDPGLLYAAASVDSRYRRVALARELELQGMRSAGPVQCMATTQALQKETRLAMSASVETDSYTLIFPAPLDPIVQVAAVGQPDERTSRLLVVFAVPGARLTPAPRRDGQPGVQYELAIRVAAVDRARATIVTLDTVRTFVARDTLRGAAHLSGLLEMDVPAGDFDVRVAVFRPGGSAGSAVAAPGVHLSGATSTHALSDIVLGAESSALRWANRGNPVLLNALNAYAVGSAAPLYYEMYGLVPGRSYGTTIALRRVGQREDRGVRLLFAETADATSMQIRRTMGLEGLSPGQYRLTVTVVDAETGAQASRERTINVVD